MAKRKKKQEENEVLIDLVETRDKAQSFIEKNQVAVFGAIVGLVALFGIFVVYKGMILPGKQDKALAAMYKAEEQFAKDSFNLALSEPFVGELGLNQFVKEYGPHVPGTSDGEEWWQSLQHTVPGTMIEFASGMPKGYREHVWAWEFTKA